MTYGGGADCGGVDCAASGEQERRVSAKINEVRDVFMGARGIVAWGAGEGAGRVCQESGKKWRNGRQSHERFRGWNQDGRQLRSSYCFSAVFPNVRVMMSR